MLRQGLIPVAIGLALGLAMAIAGSRFLAALLFGVEARDPIAFVGAAVFLTCVAMLATALPARRAARVDPMIALRQD